MIRLLTRTGLGAIALGVLTVAGLWIAGTVQALIPTNNTVAVDAVADGAAGNIQASAVYAVGQSFAIEHEITASPDPWTAEQTNMTFNPAIIAPDPAAPTNPVHTNLGGATLCGDLITYPGIPTPGYPSVYGGCARLSGFVTDTGVTRTWYFMCVNPGTTPLHLLTNAEVGVAVGTNFALQPDTGDPITIDASVTCVLPLTKDDGQPGTGTYLAGGTVTWTIHVSNPTALSIPGAPITDTVPAPLTNVQYVSSTNGQAIDDCNVVGNTVTCNTPVIQPDPVGFDLVISADIPLSAAGQTNICNTASQQGGDSDTDCIDVAPASVSVTKSADQPNYQAGDPISWTITVTSGGPSPAADVVVTDTPTDGWAISSISQVSGPACALAQPATANCGTLNAGDVVVLQVSGTVNDPNPSDNTCNNSVTVTTSNDGTASASAAATCLSKNVRMIKDLDGDPNTDDSHVNLWICLGPTCTNNGEGFLDIQELVLNVSGDPDGVGAFEFQLKFDHKAFDVTITPTNWLYSTGRIPGAPGIGGCAVTIVLENDIRFGCVSKDDPNTPGIQTGVQADGAAAIIHVTPEADLVHRITPGQRNGQVRVLLNENCELADIFGDPLSTGQVDDLGRPILLPGIVTGGLVEDCADMVITVRMLEGDLNLDCTVDLADDQIIAKRYGAFWGSLAYDPFYDLEPWNKDMDVDIKDLQKVFGRNGSTCQNPIPAQPPEQAAPNGPNP